MKQYLMAAACVAALCASAPAFAQTTPNPASPAASPTIPSTPAPPAANGGCLPGQVLDATGNPCPSIGPSSSAQAPTVPSAPYAAPSDTAQAPSSASPGTSPSNTAQAPAIPSSPSSTPSNTAQAPSVSSPGTAPSSTAQATPPSSAPSSDVASAGGSNFITDQADNQYLASNLMGKDVQDASGNKIGSIKDVLFDDQGKMAAVVIGVGGFLGIGEKSIAISFAQVKPTKDANGNVMMSSMVTQDDLNSAPTFMTLDDQKAAK
jgi:sporulation protein YlmC with PRC-barrel domain